MLKTILVVAALALAAWVPTALADSGAPAQPSRTAVAAPAQNRPGQLRQRLQQLREKVIRATVVFRRRCQSGKADPARCTAAAERLLAGLQKVDARIGTLVGKIQARCDSATGAAVPQGCRNAERLVKVLQEVQARLQTLEQNLQGWLASPPAGGGSSAGQGSDGLAPLDGLAGALAGARAATAANGF